ncbi:MAG: replication restart helicase PriA [Vulcanimicrobiaceae bacterium]
MLPVLRTARFDRTLTYALAPAHDPHVGSIVRVPLGTRTVHAFAVSEPRMEAPRDGLRAIVDVVDGGEAFTAEGLRLARWLADRYLCSLADALGCIVHAASLPRTIDWFSIGAVAMPATGSAPPRLVQLIWEDLREGFSLDALLHHADARRAGDRGTLLRALGALVRTGALVRRRRFERPRIVEREERILEIGTGTVRGPRAAGLIAFVQALGRTRRRDALLAGFSPAVLARALAAGALVERRVPTERSALAPAPYRPEFVATGEQRAAIDAIAGLLAEQRFAETLLAGVTGSGKTLVYIEAIARALAAGGQAIVLVPEIALTPQTARRFEVAFGSRVAVLHSGLSERERFESWRGAQRGEIDVVVGARSAVFAPLARLAMIVVDEAHERSYKQETLPRYQAVEVARERMRMLGGVLVLGSATPPLRAHADALAGRIVHLRLTERATAQPMPAVHVVDMAAEFARGNRRIFSTRLVEAIAERLQRREKSILFLNRRGSARFALCRACGWVPECTRCSISLTIHRADRLLRCHLCDLQQPLPPACLQCGGPLREFGIGTQRVVEMVTELFPQARIVRMDGDTTTRIGAHARLLDEFAAHGDVLVGTQMVAKGLDFPDVTLVGVIAADADLHVPEFRAAERTFDLLAQVAGRSGRARAGEAIVQTYSPEHPAIRFAALHDYDGFAGTELAERRELGYPPARDLVYCAIVGRRLTDVVAAAERYAELLRTLPEAEVLGPAPFSPARVNDAWRYRIAVKLDDAARLREHVRVQIFPIARADRSTRLIVDIDP